MSSSSRADQTPFRFTPEFHDVLLEVHGSFSLPSLPPSSLTSPSLTLSLFFFFSQSGPPNESAPFERPTKPPSRPRSRRFRRRRRSRVCLPSLELVSPSRGRDATDPSRSFPFAARSFLIRDEFRAEPNPTLQLHGSDPESYPGVAGDAGVELNGRRRRRRGTRGRRG